MNSEKSNLRTAAVAAGLVGSIVSLSLMVRACNQNPSRLVLVLIGIWVVSPFVALLLADSVSKRWPLFGRVTVRCLALVVSLGATAIYSLDAVLLLSPRKGFVFAAVPGESLVLIALVLLVAACLTGMSYQQVLARTAPTGAFSGFRYATASEVLDLYTSASIPGPGDFLASSPVGDAVVSLISLIGATSSQDGHPEAIGISGTRDGFGRDVLWCDFFYSVGVPEYDVLGPGGFIIGESFGFPDKGSWLVTAIPEPSVGLLGVLVLIHFFFSPCGRNTACIRTRADECQPTAAN